jgi:drug/metabolite transporter (DMT)-like permease
MFLATALIMAAVQTGSLSGAWSAFDVLEARHIGWFGLSMVASYGLGDSIFLMSSRAIGIPAALTIASTYPLLTAGWGAFVHHEWLTVSQVIGLLFTVCGVSVVILSTPKTNPTSNQTAGDVSGDVSDDSSNDESSAQSQRVSRSTGIFFAFLASVCWATNSYCVMRGGQDISAPVANTVRMGAAIILCIIFGKLLFPKSKMLMPAREFRRWLWIFVLEAFGGSYFFMYGLSHSSLAIGSALASLAPVISVPVALALGLEKFSWKRTAGVITVVLGLTLLVGGLNS